MDTKYMLDGERPPWSMTDEEFEQEMKKIPKKRENTPYDEEIGNIVNGVFEEHGFK